jgi:oxygen-independent coproporphyrinogen-3 oxidase
MGLKGLVRNGVRRLMIPGRTLALENRVPRLQDRFRDLAELGLYLHVPFCRQICPYCPYNKEIYSSEAAAKYAAAVCREVDAYAELIGDRPVTSFYIGGGTPTTMLHSGLDKILRHILRTFRVRCGIHMESHPNDLSEGNLATIVSLGVTHLSIGLEALQDRHLRILHRPYTVREARAAVDRALSKGFQCVNVDTIFALPEQTYGEVREAGRQLARMGVDQIAAYPLFRFPYTAWDRTDGAKLKRSTGLLKRRRMLKILEEILGKAGFERTSVWAFTRQEVEKYCSVTVPLYVGLGASGGSYLRDLFYLNTFSVQEYIGAVEGGRSPIALSIELTEEMQMAGWLYWRIYETRFKRSAFRARFGASLDSVYGNAVRALSLAGFVRDDGDELVLTNDGIYWLHALQDLFSIDYVSKLWGTSQRNPWPERVLL